MPPPDATVAQDLQFAEALQTERRDGGLRGSRVRLVSCCAFGVLFVVLGVVLKNPRWHAPLHIYGAYTVLALALGVAVRRSEWLAARALLLIPLLDMPMVLMVQRSSLSVAKPGIVVGFTIAVNVVFVTLASLSLDNRLIVFTAVVGTLFDLVLELESGVVDKADMTVTVVLMALVCWVSIYGLQRLEAVLTRAVRSALERRELSDQLVRSDRLAMVGTLAASVAHDVNSPMTSVYTGLEVISELIPKVAQPSLDPERRRAMAADIEALVANALEGAEAVRRLVRDLTALARMDVRERDTIELRSVVEGAVNVARHTVQRRASLELDLGAAPQVLGDAARLGQVFVNLLINAAQAVETKAGDQQLVRVTLGTEPSGWALVEVRDTGIGISEELRQRIFEPFFTTKAVGEGTGLGLHICHTIVTAHAGTIDVESRPGEGAVFRVRLPPTAVKARTSSRAEGAVSSATALAS